MKHVILVCASAVAAIVCAAPVLAEKKCDCLSVAADVSAAVRAKVANADKLYAAGDIDAALDLYGDAYAETNDAVLLYAMGRCQQQLGKAAEARARFEAYLASGAAASLDYGAEARGAVSALGGAASDVSGGLRSGVGTAADTGAGAGAAAGAGVGAGVGAGADLTKKAEPPKVAKGPAIILGVVAVAAVGAVGVQSITAGIKDDVDFDTKFNLSLGLTGAVVGGTAIYLWGLTAATGAADCPTLTRRTVVTPVAHRGGGGVAASIPF